MFELATPSDAELLDRMGRSPIQEVHRAAATTDSVPQTDAKKPRAARGSKRKPALDPADGICPKHQCSLTGGAKQRGCLMTGCTYLETLVDGKWVEDVRGPAVSTARCPTHGFELRVTPSGKYRDCVQRGCGYTEMLVNDQWSQVVQSGDVPTHAAPPVVEEKQAMKLQSTLAKASQPITEQDPLCPLHAKLLIMTRQKTQKLCPIDGCDYYIAKVDDGSWRVMHEATNVGDLKPSTSTDNGDEFLPPFTDDTSGNAFDARPPWEM